MSTLQKEDLLQKRGDNLYDSSGDKIGSIEEIYLDADTDAPEWALVNTGMFGTKSTFVPLRDATDDGGNVCVPYDKSQVKDAPKIDPDGELSQEQEAELLLGAGHRLVGLGTGDVMADGAAVRVGVDVGAGPARGAGAALGQPGVRARLAVVEPVMGVEL